MKRLALALGASIAVAHLALKYKQHQDSTHLFFVERHSELLRDMAADSDLSNLINVGAFADLDDETTSRFLTANRWVSLWGPMCRMGFLNDAGMRETARGFMEHESNRAFWEKASPHRRITARDKHDRAFNALMDDALRSALAAS